jgi:hypothetical protein
MTTYYLPSSPLYLLGLSNNHNHPVKKEEKKPSSINARYSTRWIVFVVVNFSWYPYFENEHEGRQLKHTHKTKDRVT